MCDYGSWCRLCAQDNGSDIDINGSDEKCTQLKQQICKYLGLTISEDGRPQTVCNVCTTKLKSFDSFATQCNYVQNLFQAILNRPTPPDSNELLLLKTEFNITDLKDFEIDIKDTSLLLNPLPGNEDLPYSRRSTRLKSNNDCVNFEVVIVKQEDSDEEHRDGLIDDYDELDNDEYEPPKKRRGRPAKQSLKHNHLLNKKKTKSSKLAVKNELSDSDDDDFLNDNSDDQRESDLEHTPNEIKNDNNLTSVAEKKESTFKFSWDCFVCDESYKTYGLLQKHCTDIHDADPKITCICGKILKGRASLRRHKILHSKNCIKCEQCHKVFTKKKNLNVHMKSHLPKEELPFVCYHCGARYGTESRLRRHEVAHIPNEERQIHPCPHCDKRFMKRQAVDVHIKAVHLQEKPFVCHECGRAFSSKGTLNEHLLIHTDDAPFICQCGKSFKTSHRLKLHSDTHRDTRYQCPVCSLQLNTKRTLRQHLVIHKDVKAYQCSVCNKGFKRYKGLKTHEILHSGRRPYSCPFCDRTFTNGSNCRSHKRRMHPEELAAYEAALAVNPSLSLESNENTFPIQQSTPVVS